MGLRTRTVERSVHAIGGFFPLPDPRGAELTPLRHAVQLLNRRHDLLHVLGAYETHDADEAAVQSFVLGNAPVIQAAFRDIGIAPRTVFPTRTQNSCSQFTERPFFARAPTT